ncbi:MAG: molybdopterin-dependent oxidoreductase [Chloroflexi bacterium]|nr:molybdopterin-dependent oxidoreductase [Chloroflexota bacterium]
MDKQRITFTVNGEFREVMVPPDRLLMKVLREDLGLTGTKQGCDGGECGTCTVLMDGRATMSCLLPVSRAQGRDIVTIEGLARGGELHPLQEAFIAKGAVQCGFCTPGMILEAEALLQGNPNPSREDVVRRLSRHLCRCTGYVKIIDAVLYGAHLRRGGEREEAKQGDGLIGSNVLRLDGRDKVLGETKYAADLFVPGMLHARILHSPYPHALIKSIDVSYARLLPGVETVITGQDVPPLGELGLRWGAPMATDRVRHVGEPVAVVVAATEEIASEALTKIRVDYELLEPVYDIQKAMKKDAPQLHPDGNVQLVQKVIKGDAEKGFALADVIVENSYQTPYQEHAYLEPEASLAYIDDDGCLVVKACTQFPYACQSTIARLCGLPENMVRIVATPTGGGFGGKYVEFCWVINAFLVHRIRKPVKLVYSREWSLLSTVKRHPAFMTFRTGATRDGKLVAMEAMIAMNTGAHHLGRTPSGVPRYAAVAATGPYHIPNVKIQSYGVCTNGPKSGAFRGLGVIQVAFAFEQQMDQLAQKLGIDPWELRRRNALTMGSETITGHVLDEGAGAKDVLEAIHPHYLRALQRAQEEMTRRGPDSSLRRGVGLACLFRAYGGQSPDPVHATAELLPDGRIQVRSGAVEIGAGMYTTIAQITAQEAGAPLESITVIGGDTREAPFPFTTSGEKTTIMVGSAVFNAAQQLKEALVKVASELLEEPGERVQIQDGYAFSLKDPSERIPLSRLAAVAQGKGVPLKYLGSFRWRNYTGLDPETGQGVFSQLYGHVAQVAEVDVNIQTGKIKVLRVTHSGDVGRVLNPMNLEGQAEGAIVTGLGFALKENFIPGHSRNFKTYSIPTTYDVPEMEFAWTGELIPSGPFGGKGGGEIPIAGTPVAIANAVAHAIGARIFRLPATPERVLEALNRK